MPIRKTLTTTLADETIATSYVSTLSANTAFISLIQASGNETYKTGNTTAVVDGAVVRTLTYEFADQATADTYATAVQDATNWINSLIEENANITRSVTVEEI